MRNGEIPRMATNALVIEMDDNARIVRIEPFGGGEYGEDIWRPLKLTQRVFPSLN
jgi:hypothetical protein